MICQNGQEMSGFKFLYRATCAFGFPRNRKEGDHNHTRVLKHLLKTSGFALLDRDYFQDPNNVRADLSSFARQLGSAKCPLDLNTGNLRFLNIKCHNGQERNGITYIRTAASALGLADGVREASSKQAQILKHLLGIAGFEIPEYAPLDSSYFQNLYNVRFDLDSFARQLGEQKTPLDLSGHNMASLCIICRNGQKFKGEAYLRKVAVALGLAMKVREAGSKQAQALSYLVKVADFKILDNAYYRDSVKVCADLNAFAVQCGEGITPYDLNEKRMRSISITSQNGQVLSGIRYLYAAARAFGFAGSMKEARSKFVLTLSKLKEIAGFVTPSDDQ
jgi:hypothetical protein